MTSDPTSARSFLFVPATRPDRVGKALASGADAVVVDLEDAVAESDKATARLSLSTFTPAASCVVRINGADTPHHRDDIAAVADLAWVTAVIVPKVEGKVCIHPAQVPVVNEAFTPSAGEVRWARGVLDAAAMSSGVFAYDGSMVDEPVLRRARAIVAAAAPEP